MNNITKLSVGLFLILCIALIVAYIRLWDFTNFQAAHNSKILCSAKFVSGRTLDEAILNSVRVKLPGDRVEINGNRVSVTTMGVTRSSVFFEGTGCVALPKNVNSLTSVPENNFSVTPEPNILIKRDIFYPLQNSITEMFESNSSHIATLVVQDGKVIAEKYASEFNSDTKFESWSMTKSITATLIGMLIQQGRLSLDQNDLFEEWSGDERSNITIANLLNMASGLRFSNIPADLTGLDMYLNLLAKPIPDHIAVYAGMEDVFSFSINAPLEHSPNTVQRYKNSDPLILGALFKREVLSKNEKYHQWVQQNLFGKLGTQGFTLETDAVGNIIASGFGYGTADAWAKLGLLYLQNGLWGDEQLIPASFIEFVRKPVPFETRFEYGGLFWLNQSGKHSLPKDTFFMKGNGGQRVFVIPSYNAVVVRFSHTTSKHDDTELNALLSVIDACLKDKCEEVE